MDALPDHNNSKTPVFTFGVDPYSGCSENNAYPDYTTVPVDGRLYAGTRHGPLCVNQEHRGDKSVHPLTTDNVSTE